MAITRMLTDDDQAQIRREIVVAILGIMIGVLTTLFNKIVEAEYQYQRNLRVLEYDEICSHVGLMNQALHTIRCDLAVRASGLKQIRGVHLSVTAQPPAGSKTIPAVKSLTLALAPSFAPPDPLPQIQTSAVNPAFAAVLAPRMLEPQRLIWTVEISSAEQIDIASQIQRVVSTEDDQARVEEGSGWRWRRWVPLGAWIVVIPLAVITLLLIAMWSFRAPQETRRNIAWE